MDVFAPIIERKHEQVCFCYEESAGLRCIIAIHDTTLGPALGGVRIWNYATEEDAFMDALRLSKAMTYKAAVAGLGLGGGKAVILCDPKQKTEALMRAFGRFVDTLGGRYITAEDVNSSVEDMEYVLAETKHVCGIPVSRGGSGDPSPLTGFGVWHGIKATCEVAFGTNELNGVRVAVQGLGKVGFFLCKHLKADGAHVIGSDIDPERCEHAQKELGIELCGPQDIIEQDCDVLAPCALGGVINDKSLPKLRCKVVAGGANNQLAEERHGAALEERGILYAPDYVINAGGLINVYCEIDGYNQDRALRMCTTIRQSLKTVYQIAKAEKITTAEAAKRMAIRRIESIRKLRRLRKA